MSEKRVAVAHDVEPRRATWSRGGLPRAYGDSSLAYGESRWRTDRARADELSDDATVQTELLEGVARSFAVTTAQLPGPLRHIAGNVYLLCRIADTIEDEPTLSEAQKRSFSARLVEVVAGRKDAASFAWDLGPLLSSSTTEGERTLVARTAEVVRITHGFHAAQRRLLERCVRILSSGMMEFQERAAPDGLRHSGELDLYCYYVAGVVGETLTALFCEHSPRVAARRDDLLALAVSHSQGLQMINILKDVWEDQRRGVCWLPRDVLLAHGVDPRAMCAGEAGPEFLEALSEFMAITRRHLANGVRYVTILPRAETGIRRSCLWALGLAVLTLRRIHRNPAFTSGDQVKVSRRSVRAVVIVTSVTARSNFALRFLFRAMTRGLP